MIRNVVLRMRWILFCIMIGILSGCGSASPNLVMRDATVSANATATTLETMQSLALVLYKTEQELAIVVSRNLEENKDQVKARVQVVRTAWEPVWSAFAKARIAYEVLCEILQAVSPSQQAIQAAVTQQSTAMTGVTNQLAIARTRVQGGIQ